MPFITVAIPTYRRLPMLRRAVESVFAQTFTDWEMVVSDDETPSGNTWNFLEGLAASDRRVRPIMNDGPHGATFNHSNALKAARGEWIKILHDDDVLKPNCLKVLAHIVREYRNVIAVSCACESFFDGRLIAPFYRRDRAVLEQMEPVRLFWPCISLTKQGGRYRPNKWCIARSSMLASSSRTPPASRLFTTAGLMHGSAHEVQHWPATYRWWSGTKGSMKLRRQRLPMTS
jgi:glycosyltransferase involved in cell wall biosynthesis